MLTTLLPNDMVLLMDFFVTPRSGTDTSCIFQEAFRNNTGYYHGYWMTAISKWEDPTAVFIPHFGIDFSMSCNQTDEETLSTNWFCFHNVRRCDREH